MLEPLRPFAWLTGRILLSLIFLLSGGMKVMNWSATEAQMGAEGMRAVPFFLAAAIAVELVGGLALLLGWQARIGGLMLALFLIPVTLIFHDFWTYTGPEMESQMQHFLKNVTIMGGLFTIAGVGAGPYSIDEARTERTAQRRISREEMTETAVHH